MPTPPGSPQPQFATSHLVYLWLTTFFVSCLLIADVLGPKLFHYDLGFTVTIPLTSISFSAIEHTCGMLTFPVTFILTDLLNEYYGKKGARRTVLIGFAMGLFVFLVINIAQAMPYLDAPFNVSKASFDQIFGSAKIMYIASLLAYLAGNLCDIMFFAWFKRKTKGKYVWLRATGSTVLSQLIDSFIVSYLAFGLGRQLFPAGGNPPAPFADILKIAATGYTLKFLIAIGITPIIYAGRAYLHRGLGMQPLPPE